MKLKILKGIIYTVHFLIVAVLISCSNKHVENNTEQLEAGKLESSVPSVDSAVEAKVASRTGLISRKLLDIVELSLPDTFKIMDEEMIALKYPIEHRGPFVIYTNGEGHKHRS